MNLFDITFRVTPEKMAELVIDHAGFVHSVTLVEKAAGTRKRYTHRKSRNSTLTVQRSSDGDLRARTDKLAFNIAITTYGMKTPFSRSALTAKVADAFRSQDFAASGASPAISSLIKGGFFQVEEPHT